VPIEHATSEQPTRHDGLDRAVALARKVLRDKGLSEDQIEAVLHAEPLGIIRKNREE
jgi:hypothetical protein